MTQSAYVSIVPESTVKTIRIDDVRRMLEQYISRTEKTGKQLDWDYAQAAFPYTIEEQSNDGERWLYLKSTNKPLYKYILIGVQSYKLNNNDEEQSRIQIVLPNGASHGDKAKANEFCKFLANECKAELTLFNGRKMYYYPRKP